MRGILAGYSVGVSSSDEVPNFAACHPNFSFNTDPVVTSRDTQAPFPRYSIDSTLSGFFLTSSVLRERHSCHPSQNGNGDHDHPYDNYAAWC
jgi:hypothetical protein